ncbi:YggS family pyridoxal phosphate-dependent enzyme, partial [bacterium]
DSLKLAEKLDRLAAETGRTIPVLLEFNLGDEDTKSGWTVSDKAGLDKHLPDIEKIVGLNKIKINGLMTMPPLFDEPEDARPYFIQLRELRNLLAARFPAEDWAELSMGTSTDFEIAVEEGATLVRVGHAILGPRPYPK